MAVLVVLVELLRVQPEKTVGLEVMECLRIRTLPLPVRVRFPAAVVAVAVVRLDFPATQLLMVVPGPDRRTAALLNLEQADKAVLYMKVTTTTLFPAEPVVH